MSNEGVGEHGGLSFNSQTTGFQTEAADKSIVTDYFTSVENGSLEQTDRFLFWAESQISSGKSHVEIKGVPLPLTDYRSCLVEIHNRKANPLIDQKLFDDPKLVREFQPKGEKHKDPSYLTAEDAKKFLLTDQPKTVQLISRFGNLSNVYGSKDLPGWVLKIPKARIKSLSELSEMFAMEVKRLIAISEQERLKERPVSVLDVIWSPDFCPQGIDLKNEFNNIHHPFFMALEKVSDEPQPDSSYYKLKSWIDDQDKMAIVVRQMLLHGLTMEELGMVERDRTPLDYFWNSETGQLVVIDFNVVAEESQLGDKSDSSREIQRKLGNILFQINQVSGVHSLEYIEFDKRSKYLDAPGLHFVAKLAYGDLIPAYGSIAEAIKDWETLIDLKTIPDSERDARWEKYLGESELEKAWWVAFYTQEPSKRQNRLDEMKKHFRTGNPYEDFKKMLQPEIKKKIDLDRRPAEVYRSIFARINLQSDAYDATEFFTFFSIGDFSLALAKLPTAKDYPSIGILRDFATVREAAVKIYPYEDSTPGLYDFFYEDNKCDSDGFKHAKMFYEIMIRLVNGGRLLDKDSVFIDDVIKIVKQEPNNPKTIGIKKEAMAALKRIKNRTMK